MSPMTTEENPLRFKMAKLAGHLTLLSMISPLTGLIVEILLASTFGASGVVDAYRVCALVIILSYAIFQRQVFPHALVPEHARLIHEGQEIVAWRLVFYIVMIFGCFTAAFVVSVWTAPLFYVEILGPGLEGQTISDASLMVRFFAVAFGLMLVVGAIGSLLQNHDIFWLPTITQSFVNCGMVVAILSIGRSNGAVALSLGVLTGVFLALLLHFYMLFTKARMADISLNQACRPPPANVLGRILWKMCPLFVLVILSNVVLIIVNRELSSLPVGTLASFGFAHKLGWLAVLLPISLSTVLFPRISMAHAQKDHGEYQRIAKSALQMMLFLTWPVSLILCVASEWVVELVFGHGAMSAADMQQTATLFKVLIINAGASALLAILFKLSFSTQDMLTPVFSMSIQALWALLVITLLAEQYGAVGVAIGYTSMWWLSTVLTALYLGSVKGHFNFWGLCGFFLKLTCASVTAAFLAWFILRNLDLGTSKALMFLELSVAALVAGLFGILLCHAFRIDEYKRLFKYAFWQSEKLLRRR